MSLCCCLLRLGNRVCLGVAYTRPRLRCYNSSSYMAERGGQRNEQPVFSIQKVRVTSHRVHVEQSAHGRVTPRGLAFSSKRHACAFSLAAACAILLPHSSSQPVAFPANNKNNNQLEPAGLAPLPLSPILPIFPMPQDQNDQAPTPRPRCPFRLPSSTTAATDEGLIAPPVLNATTGNTTVAAGSSPGDLLASIVTTGGKGEEGEARTVAEAHGKTLLLGELSLNHFPKNYLVYKISVNGEHLPPKRVPKWTVWLELPVGDSVSLEARRAVGAACSTLCRLSAVRIVVACLSCLKLFSYLKYIYMCVNKLIN